MAPTRSEMLSSSPPMFKSRLVNSLIRTHPVVPLVLYGPVIVVLAACGVRRVGVLIAITLMAAGYLTWTLTEYWVHRAVFHLQPRGPRSESFVWAVHGVHHDYPNDPRRVVASPVASVPLGAVAATLFWLLLPGALWQPLAAGWGGGYLCYDLLHAYLHVGRPRTALLRWLRARHLRHHFADARGDFGVSAPYWDYVFGTSLPGRAPRRKPVRKGSRGAGTLIRCGNGLSNVVTRPASPQGTEAVRPAAGRRWRGRRYCGRSFQPGLTETPPPARRRQQSPNDAAATTVDSSGNSGHREGRDWSGSRSGCRIRLI